LSSNKVKEALSREREHQVERQKESEWENRHKGHHEKEKTLEINVNKEDDKWLEISAIRDMAKYSI